MRRLWPLPLLAAGLLAGCGEDDIRRYQVRRLEPVKPQGKAGTFRPNQRLLAAIVPGSDKTWFFKLVGPLELVNAQSETFDAFVRSVHFHDDNEIDWSVPDGWRRRPGSATRFATFQIGPEANPIELTVVALGREAGSLLDNVNRWREQLGMPAISEPDLAALIRELKTDHFTATIVDITTPAGPIDTPPSPGPAATNPSAGDRPMLKYNVPAGWSEIPASGMRAAAFQMGEGTKRAELTVIPLGGGAGGLVPNVERWRGQIGLGSTGADEIRKNLRPLEVAGQQAQLVELVGPESAGSSRQAILGAVLERGEQTWFFKLMGPADVVAQQKTAFEEFMKSVRFGAPGDG